ncbi:alpha-glucan family phosphorylase [Nocardiopsis suaedae]|uniref:glycogen phosphorylase n=1 Tax=Nocardiopsis suaedae TaxID=3018444 RepID=A0ABT4TI09_9ACTN|nr:alpha-glucan family phosphorylase [Nocardiopsis suaedae]MDA2804338.1 alpha-glucan family phosphorylase [Nocardiopsis suaedae]
MKAIRRFTVRTVLPEPLAPLGRLAANLRWAWHAPTREVFRAVDPDLWRAAGGDPVRLLGDAGADRLAALAGDAPFTARVAEAAADLDAYRAEPRWYQRAAEEAAAAGREAPPAAVAYFSAEYGLTSALPQYSGGLGILAGDHLKSASDLGLPMVGVGLLYRHGYFAQTLSPEGWQLESYPEVDPEGLPVSRLAGAEGAPAEVAVDMPDGERLAARIWVCRVGRVPLLLLDAMHEGNSPQMRAVTDRLYGGGGEHRLRQEILLGVGGVRAVRLYCERTGHPVPEVFHMNEGHAGFLGLERVREYMEYGLGFDEAVEAARAGTVFTTHTPVPAGIDRFARESVRRHLAGPSPAVPGLPADRLLALGAEDHDGGDPGVFNMAVMGLRMAQRANGVSRLHGAVSRSMFQGLWPGFDADELPIAAVTNGVHARTWVAEEAQELAARLVPDSGEFTGPEGWRKVTGADEAELWHMRGVLRTRLVEEARERLRASWRARGAGAPELGWVDEALDPEVLTIGFARRVPSYKRLTLMLRDAERLRRLLLHPDRPVQIVIAGKAHPADEGGKRLIQEIVRFGDDPRVRHRLVFLPDYDMALATALVQGCDVWLNNPLRPLEASGTSGMKSALNGGLNLSVRDGWWDEWFDGSNGWAIPTADGVEDPERRDDLEAHALYDLVENRVAPLFYDRDAAGLPKRWLEMVKHTLVSLGPKVLATRMVREYTERLYQGAADSSRHLLADGAAGARELAGWKRRVRAGWSGVRIQHVDVAGGQEAPQVGGELAVHATVVLGGLEPRDVRVEALIGRVDEGDRLEEPLAVELKPDGGEGALLRYTGTAPLSRAGACGYTVRVLPHHPRLTCPVEMGLVAVPDPPQAMDDGIVLR